MKILIFDNKEILGAAAASHAADYIRETIAERGIATIILATGTSQFETLNNLTVAAGIDWSRVTVFHLDEYVGIPDTHPASFRKYLRERFVERVKELQSFHRIEGDCEDISSECSHLNELIRACPIDVAFLGIGENGHLAFNDPPADFAIEDPYIVVNLDVSCRRQQLGEGWFKSIKDVPRVAISMSIKQILKSRCLIVSVPDRRKANAVKRALEGEISPMCPASILQIHRDCRLFLDRDSSSRLTGKHSKHLS